MKTHTIIIALLTILTLSCAPKQKYTTVQKNIIEQLRKTNPDISSFVFTEFAFTDTVMTGEMIDECIALHTRKAEKARENADKFRKRHRRRNAAAYDSVACTAQNVCHELENLKNTSGKKLYQPLYYCVRFSGRTFSRRENFQVNGFYATVDTKGNILNLQGSANGLHNGMGILLPEYIEILEKTHNN